MKKLLFILSVLALTVCFTGTIAVASAEESNIINLESETDIETVLNLEPDKEYSVDELKEIVIEYANAKIKNENIKNIVTWSIEGGLLGSLLIVYIKYRKYKHNSLEDMVKSVKKVTGDFLSTKFDEYSNEMITPVKTAISNLQNGLDTVMKVLVLMQDNTPKGKVALIEFLGSKTNNEETKKSIKKVEQNIESAENKKAEINAKVNNAYEEIVF